MLFMFIISQLLFVLILTTHGEDSFDCTGYEDDSFHPIYDADDCRHYWHCIYVDTVYMHAVRRVCPAGTEFHPILRQCETSSEVNCIPPKSPHMPRTTSTTQAWKWKYSRLFSRKWWKTTLPTYLATRPHFIFDFGEPKQFDTTETMTTEEETTERIKVLSLPREVPPSTLTLEQLSNNLRALVLNRRVQKPPPLIGNYFQPGDPNVEVEIYRSTRPQKRRTRTTSTSPKTTTTTQLLFTSENPTRISISSSSTTDSTLTSTVPVPWTSMEPMTTTTMTTNEAIETLTTMIPNDTNATTTHFWPFQRLNGQRRRKNLTLYILTSDDHKIRQFSVNQTRGILINCNQIRRRLLGRRLRQIQMSSSSEALIDSTASTPNVHSGFLLMIVLFLIFERMT